MKRAERGYESPSKLKIHRGEEKPQTYLPPKIEEIVP